MFPIIPYNYNNSRTALCFENGIMSRESCQVIATCDIPANTVSERIDPIQLCRKMDKTDNNLQVQVSLNKEGRISTKTEKKLNSHWIQCIRLADDCHSFNARLCLEKSSDSVRSNLIIEITRAIKVGHELILWFSEDILAILQMAFLAPTNIQGQKRYVCNSCSTSFEYPNPLKLHMTLECGKYKISMLWERLYTSLTTNNMVDTRIINSPFDFMKNTKYSGLKISTNEERKIDSKFTWIPDTLSLRLSPNSTASNSPIPRPFSEPVAIHSSAFKPYSTKKESQNNNLINLSQSINNFTHLSINKSEPNLLIPTMSTYPIDFRHAAHMETIVSNLGKSNQGHLCIYCGKCYSRKYGLKIHIRTHTGYKPLKCKFCLRPFGDPSNLNKHVRLHAEGDTPYKCDLCGKVLVRRRDLERHLKSRHMDEMHPEAKIEEISSSSDHSDDYNTC